MFSTNKMDFVYYKTIASIALVLVFLLSFINLLSIENGNLELAKYNTNQF